MKCIRILNFKLGKILIIEFNNKSNFLRNILKGF